MYKDVRSKFFDKQEIFFKMLNTKNLLRKRKLIRVNWLDIKRCEQVPPLAAINQGTKIYTKSQRVASSVNDFL